MPPSSSSSRQRQGQQQQQQQRRTFRGRGGPNDRRLPKHDASGRKRRSGRQQQEQEQGQPGDESQQQSSAAVDSSGSLETEHQEQHQPQENELEDQLQNRQNEGRGDNDASTDSIVDRVGQIETTEPNVRAVSSSHHPENFDPQNDGLKDIVVETSTKLIDERIVEETREKCQQEISHLLKRAQNVQESIQLSTAITDPQIWQTNVLLAVKNCVHEWRSIIHHYSPSRSGNDERVNVNADDDDVSDVHDDSNHDKDPHTRILAVQSDHDTHTDLQSSLVLPEDERFKVGTVMFLLIQLALQSGPLRGSQPGYFKRCGSDVARMALEFLQNLTDNLATGNDLSIRNDNTGTSLLPGSTIETTQKYALLGFTSKQSTQMCKWEKAAAAAVEKNKPPSKSALKQMKKGKGRPAK